MHELQPHGAVLADAVFFHPLPHSEPFGSGSNPEPGTGHAGETEREQRRIQVREGGFRAVEPGLRHGGR